ncbi:MAG: LON peptidase substrate-binding domain-containing protein [Rhodospirillales bacterium]|nr:LON peptidase substrate-binding domain-containing protein [Rhodospirillales bacterium]MDE2458375.1 LON peptidase substrate-binding domain-containing protein [Rhodospirillales bacterium]
MSMPPPMLEDLPEEFPVFPLGGALLLPQGRLPLNIFEPRYLAMVEDALGQGRYFGMVQPDKRLPRGENGPGLYRTGCLGRISAFEETGDGRYLITLSGVIRFGIAEEIEMRRGYRRVRAGLSGFAADLHQPADVLPFPRQILLDALARYFATAGIEANWETIAEMNNAALVVSLCMACPFAQEEKQALLEAKDPMLRAAALRALLEIDSFEGGTEDGKTPKAS